MIKFDSHKCVWCIFFLLKLLLILRHNFIEMSILGLALRPSAVLAHRKVKIEHMAHYLVATLSLSHSVTHAPPNWQTPSCPISIPFSMSLCTNKHTHTHICVYFWNFGFQPSNTFDFMLHLFFVSPQWIMHIHRIVGSIQRLLEIWSMPMLSKQNELNFTLVGRTFIFNRFFWLLLLWEYKTVVVWKNTKILFK